MEKRSDIQELLAEIGSSLKEKGQALAAPLAGLSDNQKTLIQNALIGSLLGGVGTGALGSSAGESALGSAIPGALLGALAGGGGTAGYQYLTGSEKFRGEPGLETSLMQEISDPIMTGAVRNPGKTVGGLAGAGFALANQPDYMEAAKNFPESRSGSKIVEETEIPGGGTRKTTSATPGDTQELLEEIKKIRKQPGMAQRVYGTLADSPTTGPAAPVSVKAKQAIKEILKGTKGSQQAAALERAGANVPLGRYAWTAIPAGLGAGYLVDRYLRGDY